MREADVCWKSKVKGARIHREFSKPQTQWYRILKKRNSKIDVILSIFHMGELNL